VFGQNKHYKQRTQLEEKISTSQEIKHKLDYVCKCALKNAYREVLLEQIIRNFIEGAMESEDI